ncbi:MAG: division/cell wall cluster transcriptional repressor MraZ [Anaerolineales bacterium]|nr:division/cell wall cluster transcriptional repressor MraZ [Anaerolineales bacterium]
MFLGQYHHSLDTKGRLTIPARFRELLDEGAFVTQGFDRCLMVMTADYFAQVYERINAMNMADPNARLLRRLIISNAYPVSVDKAGRILLPQSLRQFLNVDSETIIAGQGGYFEIWAPALWDDQMAQFQNPEANNERFKALDLSKQE